MHHTDLMDPVTEIAAHRDRISALEAWLEACDELLNGASFAQAVSIAECEIADCEYAIERLENGLAVAA